MYSVYLWPEGFSNAIDFNPVCCFNFVIYFVNNHDGNLNFRRFYVEPVYLCFIIRD